MQFADFAASSGEPSLVAWLSMAVALAALIWSIVWSVYSSKKLAEEATAREEADQREEGRRSEELELLRHQVQVSERRMQLEESAGMTAALVPHGAIPTEWHGKRAYRFGLTNTGRAHASDVDALLVDAEDHEVSEMAYEHSRIAGLLPGESGEVAVVVKDDQRQQNPLRLKVTWYGQHGRAEYVSKVHVPPE
jgi:hypothetical protein